MNRKLTEALGLIAVMAVLGLALVVWARLAPTSPPEPTRHPTADLSAYTPAARHVGRVLVSGEGRRDQLSDPFTVPDDCLTQELAYSGRVDDARLDIAWVQFAAVSDGIQAATSGPNDLQLRHEGAVMWNLPPGQYEIEMTTGNAEWRFELTCQ